MIKTLAIYKEKMAGLLSRRNLKNVLLQDAGYVVVDTELTGLDIKKDSIISIGAVKMRGSSIDIGNTFYEIVNPSTAMRHEGIVIHGITPSDVLEKPSIDTVINDFLCFCGEDIIVGHFIWLDIGFINREVKRVCGVSLENIVIDTSKIYEWIKSMDSQFSRHYEVRREDLDLFSIARQYNISVSEGHNALSDAYITAQLFQRFLTVLPQVGVKTVRDLMRIGKP